MTFKPDNFVAWVEIPVSDMKKAVAFYAGAFDTELMLDESGPNPIALFQTAQRGGIAGHLYSGKPAPDGTGPTIHIYCPDTLEATMARFEAAGGKLVSPPIAIPAGRFAYGLDPDGNSIGLFSR